MAHRQGAQGHVRRAAGGECQAAASRERAGVIWFWPATGPRPVCLQPSKARSGPASGRPDLVEGLLPTASREKHDDLGTCDPGRRSDTHDADCRVASKLEGAIAAAPEALWRCSARTAISCSSSRPTRRSRPNMSCCATILGEPATPSSRRRSPLSPPHSGPTAAGRSFTPALRHQRERQGLFRAEDDRRSGRCPAYGARARSDPRPRRRRHQQRVHAQPARALRRDPLARRAGDAGRDHAVAALVSVPSRQDVLLGAHGARAADGAAWP